MTSKTRTNPPAVEPSQLVPLLKAAGLPELFSHIEFEFIGRFSNDLWCLKLDNDVQLVAKTQHGPARPGATDNAERAFYSFAAGNTTLPIPQYLGEINGSMLFVYEDLVPFSFMEGATRIHAERGVIALASLHAAFWGNPGLPFPAFSDKQVHAVSQARYSAAWAEHKHTLLPHCPAFEPLGDALDLNLATTLEELVWPQTLLHGDAHAENLPLRGDDVLILDWEDPLVGNPGYDLAVFIGMSFSTQQRRDIEEHLLRLYIEQLQALGVTWQGWREAYRAGLVRRAANIVEIASPAFTSLPWVFERSAQAALDHI